MKIAVLLILVVLTSPAIAQNILPIPEMNDFFIDDTGGARNRVYMGGKGQLDISKVDEATVNAGLRMYYRPQDWGIFLLSINKDKTVEKSQYDPNDFKTSILFPESHGFIFSGGIYIPFVSKFGKRGKKRIIKEIQEVRNIEKKKVQDLQDKVDTSKKGVEKDIKVEEDTLKAQLDNKEIDNEKYLNKRIDLLNKKAEKLKTIEDQNKENPAKKDTAKDKLKDVVKTQETYSIYFDELEPFGNFNAFNRTIAKGTDTTYSFSGLNFEFGILLNWYYFTQKDIRIKAFASFSFNMTEITNGKNDYTTLYRLNDSLKAVPTAIRTIGFKVGLQIMDITTAFAIRWYMGSEENLISSLRGAQFMISTAVNGNFFKF